MARYGFQLEGEEKLFTLHLQHGPSSGAQEKIMMTGGPGLPFSTADRDNDLAADVNCAELLSGMTPSLPPQDLTTCKLNCLNGLLPGNMTIKIKVSGSRL